MATFPAPIDDIPGVDLKDRLMKRLQKITTEEASVELIVVGHFEYLSRFLAWLVGYDALSLPTAYGTVARLTCEPGFGKGAGRFEWLLTPGLLA